jgi:phosphoribosyl 1,2-cyclic phosphodiesterase
MFLAFKSLRSGSSGNLYLVRSDQAVIAIDMGLSSQKQIKTALKEEDLKPSDLVGVVVSHTHSDHISYPGMRVCEANGIPIYLPKPLISDAARIYANKAGTRPDPSLLRGFDLNVKMTFRDIVVSPFAVPHDVVPTVGFRFELKGMPEGPVITMATDLGHVPQGVLGRFKGADLIVLEANYDPDMLNGSSRNFRNIQRVSGPTGHLSNIDSARAITAMSRLGKAPEYVVLVHLSKDHNTPKLAETTVREYLFTQAGLRPSVMVAPRTEATGWVTVF